MTPANARVLLREYVEEANSLARAPRFYNTLTANCTNLVFDMVRVIHPGVPMDARVLFFGYLPNYAYDLGATDTSVSFEKLRDLSKIHDRAALGQCRSQLLAENSRWDPRTSLTTRRRPRARGLVSSGRRWSAT